MYTTRELGTGCFSPRIFTDFHGGRGSAEDAEGCQAQGCTLEMMLYFCLFHNCVCHVTGFNDTVHRKALV